MSTVHAHQELEPVPFFDLSRQHGMLGPVLSDAVLAIVRSGECILGPAVESLEQALAERCGCAQAVGVSSGTDALLCALSALGIGPGDEVVTSPLSFVATAQAIARLGATPVFADIDADTLNLDPVRSDLACGPRTKAILPVHLFGLLADLEAFDGICTGNGIFLVEDAAQAFGASRNDRPAGSWGQVGCHSFYPTKPLGAAGDAGAVTTSDPDLAARIRRLRVHGLGPTGHEALGGNFRMDAVQAAVLSAKLRIFDDLLSLRRRHAQAYIAALSETDFQLPAEDPDGVRTWSQFCIRHPRRDDLRAFLARRGIGSAVYYRVPLHLEPCFSHLGHGPGDFPRAERAAGELLALPVFPELHEDERTRVVEALLEFDGGKP
jgi:dTDP-4-amino-4,6-dideoxygalactose transaminase